MSRKDQKQPENKNLRDDPREAEQTVTVTVDDQPIEMTREAAELLHRIEAERDEAVAARQRALADYANFQRRASDNENRAIVRGAVGVMRDLIPVLDQFDLALEQDPASTSIEQFIGGVRMVQHELRKAMEIHGLKRIDPKIGDEFDPNRHEAMMRQEAEGIAPGHISAIMQPGYAVGDQVLRPAKVAVAPFECEEDA